MQKFHAALFAALVVLTAAVTSLAVAAFFQAHDYAVSIPQGPAVFETSLQSRISASDTSMTLVANSVRGGSTLTGYQCFTIDEGRTDMEYVCGTISGTTVSALERGVDPLTATSTNTNLKFAHRVGANVKVTDFPLIQRLRNLSNGAETFPRPLFLDVATSTIASLGTSTIPTKEYVDYVGSTGCSDASTTARGCVEIATAAEVAAGTGTGATGALLVPPNSLATSTPTASCTTACIVAAVSGKISQSFLNLTQHFVFTSAYITSASSTHATSTNLSVTSGYTFIRSLLYLWPSSQTRGQLANDGSGNLSWQPERMYLASTTNMATSNPNYATSSSIVIPAGTLNASSTIEVGGYLFCSDPSTGATCTAYLRDSTGATIGSCSVSSPAGEDYEMIFNMTMFMNNSVASQRSICRVVVNQNDATETDTAQSEHTSTINFANATELMLVIDAVSSDDSTLHNFDITVNP